MSAFLIFIGLCLTLPSVLKAVTRNEGSSSLTGVTTRDQGLDSLTGMEHTRLLY